MLATRHRNTSTSSNLATLLGLIQDPNCLRIRLFASPRTVTPEYDHKSDGSDTTLPLVAAVATYKIPGVDEVHVVFDGLFLTAALTPRVSEVKTLLEAAQTSGKTDFCTVTAPFTSSLAPQVAAERLLELSPVKQLTQNTRPEYFSHLSDFTEVNYPA